MGWGGGGFVWHAPGLSLTRVSGPVEPSSPRPVQGHFLFGTWLAQQKKESWPSQKKKPSDPPQSQWANQHAKGIEGQVIPRVGLWIAVQGMKDHEV